MKAMDDAPLFLGIPRGTPVSSVWSSDVTPAVAHAHATTEVIDAPATSPTAPSFARPAPIRLADLRSVDRELEASRAAAA